MKATEKIYDAIRICMENKDENANFPKINQMLTEFITVNATPKKPKNGPDIWKFVSKETFRPVMAGVCYVPEKRAAVACDAHVLLISKPGYVERETYVEIRWGGKRLPAGVYTRKGERPEGIEKSSMTYPDAWSLFEGHETVRAPMNSRDAVADAVRKANVALKSKAWKNAFIEVVPGMWMKSVYAELILSMPNWTKFRCRDCDNPGIYQLEYEDENYTAAFMPIIKPESDYKTTVETDGILVLVK